MDGGECQGEVNARQELAIRARKRKGAPDERVKIIRASE